MRIACLLLLGLAVSAAAPAGAEESCPAMYYTDGTSGALFAKDPDVVRFQDRYLLYYTMRVSKKVLGVGIAESEDLDYWERAGEVLPEQACEAKGIAAPAAIVFDGKVHLFYQSYGTGPKDAICHATSDDGLHFARNSGNPVFAPTGDWTVGRAIDAEAFPWKGRMLLYFATRDPDMKVQMQGVAGAPLDSSFDRDAWTQLCTKPILKPELPWEKRCIEAASICEHSGRLYMFYAGAYNNEPQQIGVAISDDGIQWERLSKYPLLPNGLPGEWNSSESGHPGVFVDDDGSMHLFFQGNNNKGGAWYLSRMKVVWEEAGPYLVRPRDGKEFHLREPVQALGK